MGNKGGKAKKGGKPAKGGQQYATPQPPPGETTSEKSLGPDPEPEFNREQYEKAKQAVEKGNIGAFCDAIKNMEVNMKDPEDQHNTLLHYCVQYQNLPMTKYCLDAGAKIYDNDLKESPFSLAKKGYAAGDSTYYDICAVCQIAPVGKRA